MAHRPAQGTAFFDRHWPRVILDAFLAIFLAGLIGAITGLLASGFMWAYFHIKPWLFAAPHALAPGWRMAALVAIPAAGGLLAAFIVRHWARGRVMTPSDVILATHLQEGTVDVRSGTGTYLASFIAIAFGNSVGQYGPMVQMGATVGHALDRIPYLQRPYAHLAIACGVAAAISAAFQAPIAGIVFALEVVLRFFSIPLFAPVTVASVTSFLVSREIFGKQVLFKIPWEPSLFPLEFALFTLLGILSGLAAVAFVKGIQSLQTNRRLQSWPLPLRLSMAGAFTGVLALAFPQILGSSTHELYSTVLGQVPLQILIGVFFLKFIASTCSLGSGMPGGVLSPSMYIGAALGGIAGHLVHTLIPFGNNDVGLYALVGMSAMASAVVGGPLAMILFVMEVTGNYEILAMVMTGVVMANIVSARLLGTYSFFDLKIRERGYDLDQGRHNIYMQQHTVQEIMRRDYVRIGPHTPLAQAHKALADKEALVAFAVDDRQNLAGYITLMHLDALLESGLDPQAACAEHLERAQNGQVLYAGQSLHHAIRLAQGFTLEYIPVLESENQPRLVGIVHENDLVIACLEAGRVSMQMQQRA